ncbi:MAG: homoserine dehydrogenase [Candidatus Latescibacterota bacterium]
MTRSNGAAPVFQVALLGFGTVGTGTARILLDACPPLCERTGVDIRLHTIVDVDLARPRPVDVRAVRLTTAAEPVVADPEIDIVVETIGGIEPARSYIIKALQGGKAVVTANKKLLALHGRELFAAARAHNTSIGFEAAVCGGVPLIGAMREGMVANRIESIRGILNGTCNYILTRMTEDGVGYQAALEEAQQNGFAEADPTMDVDGHDAAHKLTLLASLGFHSLVPCEQVHVEGIRDLAEADIRWAGELGYVVKLLGIARARQEGIQAAGPPAEEAGIELRVHPTMLHREHPLAGVRLENNAVLVRGDATGDVLFYGKGAGMMPTASAIVADIVAAARGAALPTFEKLQFFNNADLPILPVQQTRCRWYVRFNVADRPGVLARIAHALAEHQVSIASFVQKEGEAHDSVPIVIVTHETVEEQFRAAKTQIESFPFVFGSGAALRIED